MGWLIFQNESLVSSLLATTGIGQAGLQREEPYRCRAMALVTRRAGTLTRSAPCVKKSPGFLKKLGPELDSMRPLNSPVSPLVPNRASCIWFRAFPNLCRGIVSERLGHLDPWIWSTPWKPRHVRGFLSLPPPALGEGRHCGLACRRVAVCRRAVFVVARTRVSTSTAFLRALRVP